MPPDGPPMMGGPLALLSDAVVVFMIVSGPSLKPYSNGCSAREALL